MREIIDDRIVLIDGKYTAKCICGRLNEYTTKDKALKMLKNESCQKCSIHWKNSVKEDGIFLYNGKWSNNCSKCGCIRSYTRKDHARNSNRVKTSCRNCAALETSSSKSIGDFMRMYNKYSKSAEARGIEWSIDIKYLESVYTGKCALTGWDISLRYKNVTGSLDRIDSSKGYVAGNIQWVHSMVNMSKNKYDQDLFIYMCASVAKNRKCDKI